MKNSQNLTAYLDWEARRRAAFERIKDDLDRARAYNEMMEAEDERGAALCQAARADGWTNDEIDAAYERRFGLAPGHIARLHERHSAP